MKTKFLYFLLLASWINPLSAQIQQVQIDSLIKSLTTIKEEQEKVNTLNKIAWNISYNDFQLGIDYANKSIELAKKINYEKGLSNAYNTLGTIYSDLGMYDEAIKFYSLTLKISIKNNYKDIYAKTYSYIGNIYGDQNNFLLAKKYFLLANQQFNELNFLEGIIKTDISLSTIYKELNLLDSSEYYLSDAFEEVKKINNNPQLIANLFAHKSEHELEKNNYVEALQFLQDAEEKFYKLNSSYDLFQIYTVYGKFYYQQKKYALAIKYYNKAINEYGGNTTIIFKNQAYKGLSDSYLAIENYKEAYAFQTKYNIISDSINKANSKNQLFAIENAFKAEKNQLELDNLKNLTYLQKTQIEKQNMQKIAMAIGLFLSITLAFFIFRSYREKKKANNLITSQKIEVEFQKKVVEGKHKEILDSIHYAKRIQDALLTSQNYIERNIKRLKNDK